MAPKPDLNARSRPTRSDWGSLLGHRVRVMNGVDGGLMAEGEVVAVCTVPTIVVRCADGTQAHHATSLPIYLEQWERL